MEFPLVWIVIALLFILGICLIILLSKRNTYSFTIEKGVAKTISIPSNSKIYIIYNGVKTLLLPSVNRFDTFVAILSPKYVDIIQVIENATIKIVVE